MPDLTRALQGVRHPVSGFLDVACASEDTGSRALHGIRVFAGMTTFSYLIAGVYSISRKISYKRVVLRQQK